MTTPSAWQPRAPVRWGILGCGDVTEVKSGPGFQKAEGSQLVAVMRRNAALAQDYARRHAVPKWYSDADALIRDPEVDAVYIATPPGSHLEYALRVCAAGKPAYVEKPLARSAAECDQMLAAFARARLPLFVAYYRRAQPRFLKVKELLGSGVLGQLTGIRYHYSEPKHRALAAELPWRLDAAVAGGGFFLDLGSHTLDLLDFFFGPLLDVAGHAANLASPYAVEDSLAMTFRTAAGVPGTASWNFAAAATEDLFQFTGTAGRLSVPTFSLDPIRLETSAGTQTFELPNPPHVAQPLIQTVVDDLLGLGSCPSTGESAARTSRVMDQVLDSYYGGRADAFWTRPHSWPGRRQ
ncbi:MAG: Gfo/Idh/MocA family oxidoreductase [Opitutales bacterium]|jgi:predicted dehydrogenase